MLKQYSNITQILEAPSSITAQRYSIEDRNTFLRNPQQFIFNNTIFDTEFHVYAGEDWITAKYNNINTYDYVDPIKDEDDNDIPLNYAKSLDIYEQFEDLNLTSGNYRFILNFFENKIGSFNDPAFVIDKIAPNKKEIRLRLLNNENGQHLQQISNWISTVNQTAFNNQPNETYLLNFGKNQTIQFVNSVVIGNYLFVKTLNPIDTSMFRKNFKCWVSREIKLPYVDSVAITPEGIATQFNTIQGTNWQAYDDAFVSSETTLKNWNDLLGSSIPTSQQIIDTYFSGSLSGVTLNIDYTDFNNFVFYSSAKERLSNFKYKLELLEYYTQQSASSAALNGSTATTNASDFKTNFDNLVGTFDHFENFLYYKSSSGLFTNDIPLLDATVEFITGSYITPAPKTNLTRPYSLYSTTSSIFENWYSGIYESASVYDNRNNNRITRSVPEFMLLDEQNAQLETFVNMLGHHYDLLYTYIREMLKIHNRDEHPQIGMPNELLYSVAKQFGWTLTNGHQYQNLWEYILGTDESGIPLTGSNTVGDPSLPGREMTYTVWRRIVNNIPSLLKSKGTKRSIQALLACYGVPQSLITIKEYGGPRIARKPIYEKLNFDFALDLINTTTGRVQVDYAQPINSVELRFKLDDVLKNPQIPTTMNLYSVGSNDVTIDFSRGTLGTVSINGTASAAIECFNGEYLNTLLRSGSSGTLELLAQKSKFGKIVATVSASATASLPSTGTLTLGGTTGGSRLEGQLQELRLWTSSLSNDPFENHTSAPAAYDGNNDAYDELVFRLPLTEKINHAETSSLSGVQPVSSDISASFLNWSSNIPYDSIEETYYYDGISIGAGTYDDNKIRIEPYELTKNLSSTSRASLAKYDTAPLDLNKLGVFYSPQTMIDEDIISQLGYTRLDEFLGDPEDLLEKSYPDLIQLANDYWKKYGSKNDINAYIELFSLFDLSFFRQLDQLIPARVDKIKGLLVQPNLLERSKDVVYSKPVEIKNNSYTSSLEFDPQFVSINNTHDVLLNSSFAQSGTTSALEGAHRVKDMYKLDSNVLTTMITTNLRTTLSAGVLNQRYNGSKITGPGINVPTTNFPDGAPVITRTAVNPNNLVTNSGNQGGGVFSGNKDDEILIKEDPEVIVSKNDPTTETVKNNPTKGGGNIYKKPETPVSTKPVIKPTNRGKGGKSPEAPIKPITRSSGTTRSSGNTSSEPAAPTRPTTRSSGTTRNTGRSSSNSPSGESTSRNKNTNRNKNRNY